MKDVFCGSWSEIWKLTLNLQKSDAEFRDPVENLNYKAKNIKAADPIGLKPKRRGRGREEEGAKTASFQNWLKLYNKTQKKAQTNLYNCTKINMKVHFKTPSESSWVGRTLSPCASSVKCKPEAGLCASGLNTKPPPRPQRG